MSRFFVSPESVKGDKIVVAREEAHHISHVMRLVPGDDVVAFDGTGNEYLCRMEASGKNGVELHIEEVRRHDSCGAGPSVTLVQAIPKKDKMDLIVQKVTELGVACIVPAESERTVVHIDKEKAGSRRERWEKISLAAAKQCGRTVLTKVSDLTKLSSAFELIKEHDLSIIPCLSDKTIPLSKVLPAVPPESILIFIGPEGGFTPSEISLAIEAGAVPVSMGKLVLKSDTAAIVVPAIINYQYHSS